MCVCVCVCVCVRARARASSHTCMYPQYKFVLQMMFLKFCKKKKKKRKERITGTDLGDKTKEKLFFIISMHIKWHKVS